jgi:hypothetical protein
MSKNRKNELESEYRTGNKEAATVLEFDLYFQKLISKDDKIYPHHKAPMRCFAESKGLMKATEAEFDEIFKNY